MLGTLSGMENASQLTVNDIERILFAPSPGPGEDSESRNPSPILFPTAQTIFDAASNKRARTVNPPLLFGQTSFDREMSEFDDEPKALTISPLPQLQQEIKRLQLVESGLRAQLYYTREDVRTSDIYKRLNMKMKHCKSAVDMLNEQIGFYKELFNQANAFLINIATWLEGISSGISETAARYNRSTLFHKELFKLVQSMTITHTNIGNHQKEVTLQIDANDERVSRQQAALLEMRNGYKASNSAPRSSSTRHDRPESSASSSTTQILPTSNTERPKPINPSAINRTAHRPRTDQQKTNDDSRKKMFADARRERLNLAFRLPPSMN